MDYVKRRDKLRKLMRKAGLEALVVSHETNVSYLTGFRGDSSYLLLTAQDEVLVTDGRYTTQLADECPGLELHIRPVGATMPQAVSKAVSAAKVSGIGFEAHVTTVAELDKYKELMPRAMFQPSGTLVEGLREIKDKEEIAELRRAVHQAQRAFAVVRASLRGSATEKQICDRLEFTMRDFGADGSAFPPIVAVGPQAALPHALPGSRRVDSSPILLIDWGADAAPYKSDLTRVLVTGKISPKLERIYRVVLNAQRRAIETMGPGVPASKVDRAARAVIEKAGFKRYFNHGLGHGLGMQVHESPRLAGNVDEPLKPGQVITIEPGIYIPGWGGVRIEDDVLVTRDGYEVLSDVPKEWEDAIAPL